MSDRLGAEGRRVLGQRIRALRQGRYSLDELAILVEMSSGSIGQIERGETDPTLGTVLGLMRVLELRSIESLLGDTTSAVMAAEIDLGSVDGASPR